MESKSAERNKRFDDLIVLWKSGNRYLFDILIEEYNKRTTKWSFWEYLKLSVQSGDIDYQTAFEISFYFINCKLV